MIYKQDKNQLRQKRKLRGDISGTAERPRLSVYRSSAHIYAQVIDDVAGVTLVSSSTLAKGLNASGTKKEKAELVGQDVAKKALEKGITAVVFDRGGYIYTGRVKSLAEGARKGGLKF